MLSTTSITSTKSTSYTLHTPAPLFLYPAGDIVGGSAAFVDEILATRVVTRPLRQTSLPQKIFIVELEFFKTGTGDVCQFEFGFFRGSGCLASFGDVLYAGASSLHHLIVGAAAFCNVAITEPDGNIINQLRDPEAFQVPVTAMFRDERLDAHLQASITLSETEPDRISQSLPMISPAMCRVVSLFVACTKW